MSVFSSCQQIHAGSWVHCEKSDWIYKKVPLSPLKLDRAENFNCGQCQNTPLPTHVLMTPTHLHLALPARPCIGISQSTIEGGALIQKYDYAEKDLSMGYWNSEMKLGVVGLFF